MRNREDPSGGLVEQPVFKMFPHLDEWPTKDVFVGTPAPQPHAPHFKLFSYSHRLTDTLALLVPDEAAVIKHISLNPLAYEQALSDSPLIAAAIVFGDRRSFPGLLVELVAVADDGDDKDDDDGEVILSSRIR